MQDRTSIALLEAMCSDTKELYDIRNKDLDLPPNCYIADDARICQHLFKRTIIGLTGRFTNRTLDTIHRCLAGRIQYIEMDAHVRKAEDEYPERSCTGRQLSLGGRRMQQQVDATIRSFESKCFKFLYFFLPCTV